MVLRKGNIGISAQAWRSLLRSRLSLLLIFITLSACVYVLGSEYRQAITSGMATSTSANLQKVATPPSKRRRIRYSILPGYFAQSEKDTESNTFNWRQRTRTTGVLGLVKRQYESNSHYAPDRNGKNTRQDWPRFEFFVNWTNENAGDTTEYKVIYMGRHGEGEHNVAERDFGTEKWNEIYSKDERYIDARLTNTGYAQAQEAGAFWDFNIKNTGIALPQSYYVSPLSRCLTTAMLTWGVLELPKWRQFRGTVKEGLRETMGVHTCDQRSSKTWIFEHFSGMNIERGFTEKDELWKPDVRETKEEHITRAKALLDDIFKHDNSTFISFTTHSGTIASILEVVGHRPFPLNPGDMIAVLVRADWDLALGQGAIGDPESVTADEAVSNDEEALKSADSLFPSEDVSMEAAKKEAAQAGVLFE